MCNHEPPGPLRQTAAQCCSPVTVRISQVPASGQQAGEEKDGKVEDHRDKKKGWQRRSQEENSDSNPDFSGRCMNESAAAGSQLL